MVPKIKSIPFFFLPVLLILLAMRLPADRDAALVGNWRAPKPNGPDDSSDVYELRFDKKGKVAMFRIRYDWDAETQTWTPATADQPAQGDNDEWATENGFITMEIRERYMTNRDLVCRYTIRGDTLRLQMAEIFRPVKGEHDGIFGSWKMETYDQAFPGQTRTREITIHPPGQMIEKVGENEFQGRIFPVAAGWKQLAQLNSGAREAVPDTIFQPIHLAGGNLYLYQTATWLTLIRRK